MGKDIGTGTLALALAAHSERRYSDHEGSRGMTFLCCVVFSPVCLYWLRVGSIPLFLCKVSYRWAVFLPNGLCPAWTGMLECRETIRYSLLIDTFPSNGVCWV